MATADFAKSLFAAIDAIYTATVSGGIGLGACRSINRAGDNQHWDDRALPFLNVEIIEDPISTCGTAGTAADHARGIVRFHVWTRADLAFDDMDTIMYQIRTQYHRVALASQNGWDFDIGLLGPRRIVEADQRDKLHAVCEMVVMGTA